MLTNVPTAVARMARNVVINHPNTFNCQVFRRTVNRPDPAMGGVPTLGGMGVLDSEDEEKISYAWLGNGYAMMAEPFQAAPLMDRQDANNYSGMEFRMLIVPEAQPGVEGDFTIKTHDVAYLLLGDSVRLAFEVVGVESPVNIPPYLPRYVVNRRDDLHVSLQS